MLSEAETKFRGTGLTDGTECQARLPRVGLIEELKLAEWEETE